MVSSEEEYAASLEVLASDPIEAEESGCSGGAVTNSGALLCRLRTYRAKTVVRNAEEASFFIEPKYRRMILRRY